MIAPGGGLDLLDDDARVAADGFAARYRALRIKEGWADPSGRERPDDLPGGLWTLRLKSVSEAAAILRRGWTRATRMVVADIGAGGGWAARLMDGADVIAFDLLDAGPSLSALAVRADMSRLPLRDDSVDGTLYAASLHYAPIAQAVAEAARVLRPLGILVAVDSPMYRDRRAQAKAVARTAAYYARSGYPELAAHYHPIEVGALKSALEDSGFALERFDAGRPAGPWSRLTRQPRPSMIVATLAG